MGTRLANAHRLCGVKTRYGDQCRNKARFDHLGVFYCQKHYIPSLDELAAQKKHREAKRAALLDRLEGLAKYTHATPAPGFETSKTLNELWDIGRELAEMDGEQGR